MTDKPVNGIVYHEKGKLVTEIGEIDVPWIKGPSFALVKVTTFVDPTDESGKRKIAHVEPGTRIHFPDPTPVVYTHPDGSESGLFDSRTGEPVLLDQFIVTMGLTGSSKTTLVAAMVLGCGARFSPMGEPNPASNARSISNVIDDLNHYPFVCVDSLKALLISGEGGARKGGLSGPAIQMISDLSSATSALGSIGTAIINPPLQNAEDFEALAQDIRSNSVAVLVLSASYSPVAPRSFVEGSKVVAGRLYSRLHDERGVVVVSSPSLVDEVKRMQGFNPSESARTSEPPEDKPLVNAVSIKHTRFNLDTDND